MFKSVRKQKQSVSGKLIGALFGLGMFAGAFFLLWSNEGRINYANIADDSISAPAIQENTILQGELVALEGDLISRHFLNDPIFIEDTLYIQFNRKAEMFAWEETKVTEDEDTYYEYSAEWTDSPENSNSFSDSSFFNPEMPFDSLSFTVPTANINLYGIDTSTVLFPEPEKVDLTNERIRNEIVNSSDVSIHNDYIYIGYATLDSPEIGDLRISFTAVPQQNNVTAFGIIIEDQLLPFIFDGDESLYRIFFVDRENAIIQMDEEYTAALWGARFAGFTLLWCAMFLLLNPITIIISFLPILEKAGAWFLVAITFPIAAVISILLILVSFLAHNPFVLIGFISLALFAIAAIAGGLFYLDKRKKETNS